MDEIKSGEKGQIRSSVLLLMIIFTFSAIALMWTAVDCFKRVGQNYENSSEGMASAQFIANSLKNAPNGADIYTYEDGSLDRMIIPRDNGCSFIISFSAGSVRQALVLDGAASAGDELFRPKDISVSKGNVDGIIKITAVCSDGQSYTACAAAENVSFLSSGKEASQ